ncbi:hypothetical protein CYMTET_38023 [Cymbomonas tetramitiformis]|uniref:Pyrimidine 5-nucleotidase n=1 Tax=Cymbomonas tetramitiformis TaxID=36881 RepID=A0AAE0CCQ4_9CHLO|nr:hypothetical protein CYMTET_38023 [Cymbomonas tetramitiformis]
MSVVLRNAACVSFVGIAGYGIYKLWQRSKGNNGGDIKVVFFDVDDTLYQNNWKTADNLTIKMKAYTADRLNLPPERAYQLYKQYGTTLRGLQEEKYEGLDVEDYLKFCHTIDRSDITPNMKLRGMLQRLTKVPKWCFTASIKEHALACLQNVGIADCFVDIIDVRAVNFYTKHHKEAYYKTMLLAGMGSFGSDILEPKNCLFLDDSTSNMKVAKEVNVTRRRLRGKDSKIA